MGRVCYLNDYIFPCTFGLNDLILFLGLLNLCQLSQGNETFVDNKLKRFFYRFDIQIGVFIFADNVLYMIVILYEAVRKWLELPYENSLLAPHVKSVDQFSKNETFEKCLEFNVCAVAFLFGNIKPTF